MARKRWRLDLPHFIVYYALLNGQKIGGAEVEIDVVVDRKTNCMTLLQASWLYK